MSLPAARGDGARLCPPKAQPSPPPRDLVQRILSFVIFHFPFAIFHLLDTWFPMTNTKVNDEW